MENDALKESISKDPEVLTKTAILMAIFKAKLD